MKPDRELIAEALGATPRALTPVTGGGYTRSGRWLAETAGGKVFVKQAEEHGPVVMVRREAAVYAEVHAPFVPVLVGFVDIGHRAVVATEYIADATWPPPYPHDVSPLFEALDAVAEIAPPAGLPSQRQPASRWEEVARDPEPVLRLRVCSRDWLESALPVLVEAERGADFEGDHLSHNDVYSGNVCFARRGAVLLDWGASVRGSRWIDVMQAVQSVRAEGGTLPPVELPDEGAWAAAAAGHFAVEAPAPLPEWIAHDSGLREDMRGDLVHALRWAAEALALPPLR